MDASAEFDRYMDHVAEGLGHADRRAGLQGYCTGLMLPLSRKSVEPMAARVDPMRASARHQALHHFVAKAKWSDDEMLRRVAQWVVPRMDLSSGGLAKIGSLMDTAEHEVLAHMDFPKAHWLQIHSTNPLERLNAEIKRRTNVAGIFPNDRAITRLVGAMLLEQSDEWALQRRYMRLEGLQTLSDTAPARLSAVQR